MMGKRVLLASVIVLIVWAAMDYVIHQLILGATYEATSNLWRPMGDMKMGVMYVASFIAALCFTSIYGWLIGNKSPSTGLRYGLLFGIGTGVSMGYGMYAVMPIPYTMAFTYFVGTTAELAVAGLVAGLIVRDRG